MIACSEQARTIPHSREALEAATRKLELQKPSVAQALALAEACFRLAVLPETGLERAIELMRRAVAYDPYHPKLFFHLGRLLHNNGDPLSAVFEYRRGLRLAPGNHRIFVHMALALADLAGAEQKLGLSILEALQAGDDELLAALVVELDRLIAERLDTKKKKESSRQPAPPQQKDDLRNGQRCRWRGIWKLFLLNELTGPKASTKKTGRQMEEGKRLIEGQRGVAEFAIATLLFVLDSPKTCRQLAKWLRDNPLASHAQRAAVRLVSSVCNLGEAGDMSGEQFVQLASAELRASDLPPELVCCLHYSWYGTSSNDPVKALELLDLYPEQVSCLPCFRELRLAILDHHARLAWNADRIDRAEILWQSTIDLDPLRVPVAHNLAIAATRAQSAEKYRSAWERATELRYLQAAAAGDMRVEIEDRCRLHRSFAQQSRLRYVPEADRTKEKPTEDELKAWMRDCDALQVWLREEELLYLNNRIKFYSMMHFLGVTLTCSEADAEAAKNSLMCQFELCFRGRNWAGNQVFVDLVREMAEKACAQVKDPIARRRDPYFEAEMHEAGKLGEETIVRGLLMFDMIRLAVESSEPELKNGGLAVARFLLAMPWRALEALGKKSGRLSEDDDLLPIFLSYVKALLLENGEGKAENIAAKLSAVDDYLRVIPDAMELHLARCLLLLEAKRNREVYDHALAGYTITTKLANRVEAAKYESQFVICIDNAALAEIPAHLFPVSQTNLPKMIEEGHRVLSDFSRAGGLRLLMAKFLIQAADEDRTRIDQAKKLLEEGLDLFLNDKQLQEAKELMAKAGARSQSIEAIQQIRALLQSASGHARAAGTLLSEERTPAKFRKAHEEIDFALHESSQAEEIASKAGLAEAVKEARELAAYLHKILQEAENG